MVTASHWVAAPRDYRQPGNDAARADATQRTKAQPFPLDANTNKRHKFKLKKKKRKKSTVINYLISPTDARRKK